MFSEAISSISCRWRFNSARTAPKISGSASSREAEKKLSASEKLRADSLEDMA
jgi:hypothetical protein